MIPYALFLHLPSLHLVILQHLCSRFSFPRTARSSPCSKRCWRGVELVRARWVSCSSNETFLLPIWSKAPQLFHPLCLSLQGSNWTLNKSLLTSSASILVLLYSVIVHDWSFNLIYYNFNRQLRWNLGKWRASGLWVLVVGLVRCPFIQCSAIKLCETLQIGPVIVQKIMVQVITNIKWI